jgi:hypothetical protein
MPGSESLAQTAGLNDPSAASPASSVEELWLRATNWLKLHPAESWTAETIQPIAAREGIDFATAVLYETLRRSPKHGPLIQEMETNPRASSNGRFDATIAIVPGAFYRERPETGADGRIVAEEAIRLGCRAVQVPLKSFGSLTENAAILLDWLSRRTEKMLILVSLSKSGAEVRLALDHPDSAMRFQNVAVWVNLSGLVTGTPLARWLLQRAWRCLAVRLWFWWRGHAFEAIRQIERRPGGLLDGPGCLPPHMQAIHVVGFPLLRHLSCPWAVRGHGRIGGLGPNDGGGLLLGDLDRFPGLVYPVWGADHYLRPEGRQTRDIVARLLAYLAEKSMLR